MHRTLFAPNSWVTDNSQLQLNQSPLMSGVELSSAEPQSKQIILLKAKSMTVLCPGSPHS